MLRRIAHYTEHLPPNIHDSGGLTPYYNTPYLSQDPTLLNKSFLHRLNLGAFWELVGEYKEVGGNAFMKVRAAEAFASAGQLLAVAAPTASTVAAGTTTQVVNWTGGGLTVNAEAGNLLFVQNSSVGGGGASIKSIISNTATSLTVSMTDFNSPARPADQNAYAVAPTAGDVAVIIRPNRLVVCTASMRPVAVSLGAATINHDAIVQVRGLALVQAVGNVAALVVNQPAVPGAAGVITGSAAAAANLYTEGVTILPQAAYAGAGATIPCLINLGA